MAVSKRGLRAARREVARANAVVNETTRQLARAWASGWDEIVDVWDTAMIDLVTNPENGEWPSRLQIVRNAKAQKALELTANKLEQLAAEGTLTVSDSVPKMVQAGAETQKKLVTQQLPPKSAVTWTRLDPVAIDWIVQRSTEQIESQFWVLTSEMQAVMKQTLIRGSLIGDSPYEVAELMVDRLNGNFNGGLSRAETIARTEMMDALRHGTEAVYRQNRDVLAGWRWTCTLSSRTCPACLAMDGTVFDLDEPGPLGHQNCRCTAVPITKTWAELGFTDIPEPGVDEPPTGREWFDKQPEKVQHQIMGRKRLSLYQQNKIGWDDMHTVRRTPYWRDSIGVKPLPHGV